MRFLWLRFHNYSIIIKLFYILFRCMLTRCELREPGNQAFLPLQGFLGVLRILKFHNLKALREL